MSPETLRGVFQIGLQINIIFTKPFWLHEHLKPGTKLATLALITVGKITIMDPFKK